MIKRLLAEHGLWLRRGFAGLILSAVTYLSLADSDGMRQHEVLHLLVRIYRATGIAMHKQVHAAMYFAVCGALWLAMRHQPKGWPTPLKAWLMATGWGVLMEFAVGRNSPRPWPERLRRGRYGRQRLWCRRRRSPLCTLASARSLHSQGAVAAINRANQLRFINRFLDLETG